MKLPLLSALLLLSALPLSASISDLDKKFNIKKNGGAPKTATAQKPRRTQSKAKPKATSKPVQAEVVATTQLTGLYDGEEIDMPTPVLDAVGSLNEQLKAVLSEQDYLAILKGELAWYVSKKAGSKRISYTDLKEKLNAILKDPTNDRLFRWPRFLSNVEDGVSYVASLTGPGYCGYSDDRFYFQRTAATTIDVFDVRTGKRTGILSLPCCPLTTVLTRIPHSDMYFLTLSRFTLAGMYDGVRETAEVGTWQEPHTGFAAVVDADGKKMQTFLFGSRNPAPYYDPRKSTLFARSDFPLDEYLKLTPSRVSFDDPISSSYAYTRSKDEDEVSRPSWGEWMEWTGTTPQTSGYAYTGWVPDDLYADKALRESYVSYLKTDRLDTESAGKLNLHTLRFEAPSPAAADGIKDLPAYVLEKLGGSLAFLDGWESIVEWKDVDARQANGYVAFTLTSESFQLIRHVWVTAQISGFITPEGKVYIYGTGKDSAKLSLYNREAILSKIKEDCCDVTVEELRKVLDFQASEDGVFSVIWKEMKGSADGRALIHTVDLAAGKVVSESKFDRVPERYDEESGFLITKVNDTHFRLNKPENSDADSGIDYYVSGSAYAIVLPDGRYCGSPGCEAMLQVHQGGQSIDMAALAPWRNRPAEVLRVLGGSAEDVATLESTTLRWLARRGIAPESREPALVDFPQAHVTLPALKSDSPVCSFKVQLKATAKDIAKLHVTLDGVPHDIPMEGLPVHAGESREVIVEVPLITGQNWICVTPEDADGIKGSRTRFRTIYNPGAAQQGKTYVVAMGVSDYDDESMSLQYAAKDATDVANTFKKVLGDDCQTLLLKDKQVGKDILFQVGEFLASAKSEDSVIVYLAGHGMLGEKMDYYYAPATFNVEDVEGSGISMQQITDTIAKTPARKRLLLLDTCHSGVLGEEGEEKMALAMGKLPPGVRAVKSRGMKVKKVATALNANQKKRYIEEMFSMVEALPGISVISGAAGAEYAMESGEWNNGVFTAALLEAITNSADADCNKNGLIRLPELANYVRNRVSFLTNGTQSPCANLTEEAPYFTVVKGLRAFAPLDGPSKGNWEPFVNAMRRCSKTEQDFKKVYPDIFDELFIREAPQSVLTEIERLTGGKTSADGDTLLIQACENFDAEKISTLLDAGVDANASDGAGNNALLILFKYAEQAILKQDPNLDKIADTLKKLKTAGADSFQENYYGECAADHTGERTAMAIEHAKHHIEVSNSATNNQLASELACYAGYVDFFDKGKVSLEFIEKDARKNAAEFPTRKFYNVRDIDSEVIGIAKESTRNAAGRYSYHVALTCDCDYVSTRGKKIHMVMRNHYVISFVNGKPQISAIRTVVDPQKDRENKELSTLLFDIDADYAMYERTMGTKSVLLGIHQFYNRGQISVSQQDSEGRTALHYACAEGKVMLCKWLLDHGASPNVVDKKGKTPQNYLPILNRKALSKLLENY